MVKCHIDDYGSVVPLLSDFGCTFGFTGFILPMQYQIDTLSFSRTAALSISPLSPLPFPSLSKYSIRNPKIQTRAPVPNSVPNSGARNNEANLVHYICHVTPGSLHTDHLSYLFHQFHSSFYWKPAPDKIYQKKKGGSLAALALFPCFTLPYTTLMENGRTE